jgi:hypothetical protein
MVKRTAALKCKKGPVKNLNKYFAGNILPLSLPSENGKGSLAQLV